MHGLKLLIVVSRPLTTWPTGLLFFLIGFAVSGAQFTPLVVLQLASLFLFSIVVFGLNDVYDYETDILNSRKNSLVEGKVLGKPGRKLVMNASFVSAIALLLFSLSLRNLSHLAATIALLVVGYAYSSPPFRLKSWPVVDSFSNAVMANAVMLLGFSYGGTLLDYPAKLLYASLVIAAVHAMGALMDYPADRKAGIRTIAIFFGKRFTAAFSLAVVLVVVLFSGIRSVALNAFFLFWAAFSAVSFLFPDEKFVRKGILFAYYAALAAMALFLYQQFYK